MTVVTKGRVANAAQKCIASFDEIAQIRKPESKSFTTLLGWDLNEDERSQFEIWLSDLVVADLGTERRPASFRLWEAPEIVDRIIELLEELAEINSEVLEIISGKRLNREIAEDDSDTDSLSLSSGQDELAQLVLSIDDVLASLFKTFLLLKAATAKDRDAPSRENRDNLVPRRVQHSRSD